LNHLRNRIFLVCIVLAAGCSGAQKDASPDANDEDDKPPPISGHSLLQAVTARLPGTPLRIGGDITVRKRRGIVLKSLKFHALLDLGRVPPLAQYTIMDALGNDLERLTVVRREGSEPTFMYASGNPLVTQPAPILSEAIQETDIRWMDLTFSFLWWPGGVLIGSDETRSRPCYVVEVDNPHADVESTDSSPYCAKARLWIDEKILMLIRAELLDSNNQPIRWLWIDSFKKVNDQWMIKDMEVEAEPVTHRTKLTIRDMEAGQ